MLSFSGNVTYAAGIFCSNKEPNLCAMLSTPLAISDNVSTTHSHGKPTTRETNHKGNQPTSGCELHL